MNVGGISDSTSETRAEFHNFVNSGRIAAFLDEFSEHAGSSSYGLPESETDIAYKVQNHFQELCDEMEVTKVHFSHNIWGHFSSFFKKYIGPDSRRKL